MKLSSSNKMVVAILVVVAFAVAFWILLLSPKRQEAADLDTQVEQLQVTLAQTQSTVAEAEAARKQFPHNYEQLVVLGKAVPASDETASLLVELNHVADRAGVSFESIQLGTTNGSAATESTESAPAAPISPTESTTGVPASAVVAPTEAAAALQPLGASVGPAGLNVLPYDLTFSGSFFDIADFIEEIDAMVKAKTDKVAVDGRLMTLDGFALNNASAEPGSDSGGLQATFSVTTYLIPPGQGVTAGATEAAPEAASTEVAEAAPEEASTEPSTTPTAR